MTGVRVLAMSTCHRVQTGSQSHTVSYRTSNGVSFSGRIKRLGREAHFNPITRLRTCGAVGSTSILPHAFRVWCFIKHTDNLKLLICYTLCIEMKVRVFKRKYSSLLVHVATFYHKLLKRQKRSVSFMYKVR